MLSPQFYFCFLYVINNISPSRSVFFVRQHLSPLHLPLWQISFSTKKIFTPSICWTLWKACQSNLNINPCNVLTFATVPCIYFLKQKDWQLCVQNVQLNLISLHTHGRSYRTCFSHRYKIQTVRDFLVYTVCWALHRNTLKHVSWNICICK